MDNYDIIIVGAGPIGSFLAEKLAKNNIHVGLYEEHATIGEPLHCAGLVTQRVFDLSHCPTEGIIQNKIYGATIHAPSGSSLTIGGDKTHGLVIDRQKFDETLAHKAQSAGANLLTEHKVLSAKQHNNHVTVETQKQNTTLSAQCNILIGADGPHSLIRKHFQFPHPTEILQGIGAELTDTALDPRYVNIYVGHNIAPGFFAWVIPTNTQGTTARIGLCIGKHHTHPLQTYFNTLLQQKLLKDATIMKRYGGTIPLGPLKKTTGDNVMLVGDAAAQIKPTSGGGIYPGLICAAQCAIVAQEAVQKQHYNEKFLSRYHTNWTKEIGKELSLGMRFRRLFTSFTDEQFNKYLQKLNTKKTLDVINTYGDIDYPSRLAFPLLKTAPSLLSLAPSLLRPRKKQ